MSGLPNIPQVTRSDVRDAPAWVDPILRVLSITRDYLIQLADGGIDQSNLRSHIRELEVRTGADYPDGELERVEFETALVGKLIEVRVLKIWDRDDPEGVLSGSFGCQGGWTQDAGRVRIRWIDDLQPSKRYGVVFEAR